MFKSTMYAAVAIAASLALTACQQQSNPAPEAPAAMQSAPEAQPAAPAAMTAKPEAPAPAPEAAAPAAPAMTAKPAATASEPAPKPMTAKPAAPVPAPKPATAAAMTAKPAATSPAMSLFSTTKCMACHAIDHDKVGPAWKTVVEKYGDEATLAKDFEAGFKERRVANSIAKWKSKEGLMTPQFNHLIKGHEKEAAHALFMTVKHGKFGNY